MNSTFFTSALAAIIAAAFVSVGLLGSAHAQVPTADWHMIDSQVGDNNWNSLSTSNAYKHWADSPGLTAYVGNESRFATAMDNEDVYTVAAGKTLRTRGVDADPDNFLGGTLILAGADLLNRGSGTRVANVTNLIALNGTTMRSGVATIAGFNITNLNAVSGTVTFNSAVGRGFNLAIANLSGAANIVFTAGGTYNLNIGNTSNFTGDMFLTAGLSNEVTKLGFLSNLSIDGSLFINAGNTVNLTHSVTVSALNIAGISLAADTYSYSWLNQNYGSIFTAGNTNGSITVSPIPEPSTYAALAGLGVLSLACLRRRRRN